MYKDFENRVAIITGAASGLGLAIAKKLSQKDYSYPLSMGIINKLYDNIQKKLEKSEKQIAKLFELKGFFIS